MNVTKRFHLQPSPPSAEEQCIDVLVLEKLDNELYPIFTWPASLVLAGFVVHQLSSPSPLVDLNHHSSILEIGAGTALPSLACIALGVKHCFLSEREDQPEMLEHLRQTVALNNFDANKCTVLPLSWGTDLSKSSTILPTVDVVLGADVFYSSEDFDDILLFVHELMKQSPKLQFITTYQERNSHRCIEFLLEKYEMVARYIPNEEFLHQVHREGFCGIVEFSPQWEVFNSETVKLASFDDIFLFVITKKMK